MASDCMDLAVLVTVVAWLSTRHTLGGSHMAKAMSLKHILNTDFIYEYLSCTAPTHTSRLTLSSMLMV